MVWQSAGHDPGRQPAQTSRPEPPASDPRQTRSPCSGKRDHRASQELHEWPPEAQTTDATDTKVPEAWSHGRSQTLFYNQVRPHSSIGWLGPAIYAATFSPPPGPGAALPNGPAPWPVATSVYDASNRQTLAATG